ncbi:Alpha/Beta hydrolase protein [Infundibulicybe gibba]|nr:Alpha/Beta hydrolase protein [Infundibulicybe gibba]
MLFCSRVVIWGFISSPFVSYRRRKTWKRLLGDTTLRFLVASLNIRQLQYILGTTRYVYEAWSKKNKSPVTFEELGGDARLFWIGQKKTEKVILYFHGGAFLVSMGDPAASFWKYIQEQLKADGNEVGIAVLNYSLVPTAVFPTPLNQARLALEHIIASGTHPSNIQIAGDSAGANLALQILSHLLHPLPSVPKMNLPSPLGGIYLMSPWINLCADSASHTTNSASDILSIETLRTWGAAVLADVPDAQRPYAEASKVDDSWFKGVDKFVSRVLITAGGAECLRDDIISLEGKFRKHHPDVKFIVQKDGVHNDPFQDFMVGETQLGELIPLILEWLADGFSH